MTVCTENKKDVNIFGQIIKNKYFVGADPCVCPSNNPRVRPLNHQRVQPPATMALNECGNMVDLWLNKIPHTFNINLDEYQIMPNHIHAIIHIRSMGVLGRTHGSAPTTISTTTTLSPPTIGTIIQWFKTMATNEYIRNVHDKKWRPFNKRLFQRNYYEHIIRNEKDYLRIKKYIRDNPMMWEKDEDNPTNIL